MSKVIIAGGTGLLGTYLSKMLLERNDEVYILTTKKNVENKKPGVQYVFWNPAENFIDPAFQLSDCYIINLAGASVADKRWTDARKKELLDSRIQSLQTLYHAIESGQINASHIVSSSAIGFYGENRKILTENDSSDNGFLSQICIHWENEAARCRKLQINTAILRIGIVLSKDGGALKEFLNPLKFKLAAIPGDGKQIMSWIHIDDMCRMILFLMDAKKDGIYNAVAGNPVSANDMFEAILETKKGFHIKVHIPKFILQIVLGEMSGEVLKSTHVSNEKMKHDGFIFQFEDIKTAMQDLLR